MIDYTWSGQKLFYVKFILCGDTQRNPNPLYNKFLLGFEQESHDKYSSPKGWPPCSLVAELMRWIQNNKGTFDKKDTVSETFGCDFVLDFVISLGVLKNKCLKDSYWNKGEF